MRDILPEICRWRADGKHFAIATVVKAWGSSPRPLGSRMAVTAEGDMVGSVSGGCVEGAVFEEAQSVLQDGVPKLVSYGVTRDQAWAVGLSCGGEIEIFIENEDALSPVLKMHLEEERLVVQATALSGSAAGSSLLLTSDGAVWGSLGSEAMIDSVREQAAELFAGHGAKRMSEGDTDLFLEALPPRERLVIVGAVHVAVPLVELASRLGFRTIIVDPRTAFATAERFGHADEIRTDWPDEALRDLQLNEATYVALLSHDEKLDLPALEVALRSKARYIGALGSRKTHQRRLDALRERGFSDEEMARIHSPIGLNLGGRRAEEIALSVLSEMVAVRHGLGVLS